MSEELGPPRGLKNGAVMELLKAMEREEILEVFSSPPSSRRIMAPCLSVVPSLGLIAQYAIGKQQKRGRILHAHLIINGVARLTYFATKLVSFYTELRLLPEARKLFDKIPQSNERRWVALIGAYSRRGFYQEALGAFAEMQQHGSCPNKFVIPSVLKACGHVLDLRTGRLLHCVVLKGEVVSDAFVVSSLIDMYSKCGRVEKAWWVFDTMVEKDLVALNAMVLGYVQHGLVNKGYALLEQMQALGAWSLLWLLGIL
ncbi:hypothetical protein Tsubulata_022706 [Turnera subulata]|uniref:Pentatricopeptide repeat-containing protein n=1 Tax=Turnera subulata TaxID=218843 RepID=A0A9Q0EZA1_9ROSI|nr:hypothetical protein Tsubulata_022706 [Turnera subulata]